jgi:ribonucleoside-triphosphate reductase
MLPTIIVALSVVCLLAADAWTEWSRLLLFVPYTFLGNSLAPLPYDGAVVYLGGRHPLPLIVVTAVLATVVIEIWNMELLARVLARDGTRAFREHRVTQWTLHWYRKAPFWSLVATCVLPIVPHYPMRFLVVLAGYSQWKYQLSVILGRGLRYAALASVGVVMPIPGSWILVVSLIALALGIRGIHRMNRASPGGLTDKDPSFSPAKAIIEET